MDMLDMGVLDVLILSIPRSLASHPGYCISHEAIKIELPKDKTEISLKNHNRSMRIPIIVYADFEFFTPQLSTCQQNPDKSYIKQYQKHIPSGFCYHIKCFDDTLYSEEPVTFVKEYNDDDVAQIFIDTLEISIKDIYKKLKLPKSMIITMHDKMAYDNCTRCYICNEELGVIIVICQASLEVLLMKSAT